ncbi:MAG: Uncharacterised protein [Synechococcus sp. MIT S9220]|nr:MAG: Uncharacterised protein [Synechococcus sp. MIT S9220]
MRLFDGEDRSNRSTSLGDHWIQAPGAADAQAYRSIDDLISIEQRTMIGVVRYGDASDFGDAGVGVIQSAHEIVDGMTAGIEQQQH